MPDAIAFTTFMTVVITEFCLMALLLIVIIERSFRRAFRYLNETAELKEEIARLSSAGAGAVALSVEFASERAVVDKILQMGSQSLNPDLYEDLSKAVEEMRRVRRAFKEEET